MRTPEDVKKALACCENADCKACPYDSVGVSIVECMDALVCDTNAYINQLESRIPKWISVKERLPENYEPVIIFQDNCRNACYGWMINGRWSVPEWVAVTHWMPMPEPPKEE